ncbi:uncharacterized protein [Rutidosis leptorrhynchoides]|uniref:uncharacterized protein n=1 Tax=Rutidosis leptorrhynchoides TaxID=125765 RepID=UPI003A9A48FE
MAAPYSYHLLSILLTFSLSIHGTLTVDYRVINTVPQTPGGQRFEREIGAAYIKQVMGQANNFIWSTVFQQNAPPERKNIPFVNLYVSQFRPGDGGVALTWGENNINVSTTQLAGYRGSGNWDVRKEYTAVVYHEMTHVLQWGGGGRAPGGLQEGVADFSKIKANLMQPGFAKPGTGDKWDHGYGETARFLEYCDSLAPGFVARLNKMMRNAYDVAFWRQLTGKPLEQLWKEYKAKYGNVYSVNVTT